MHRTSTRRRLSEERKQDASILVCTTATPSVILIIPFFRLIDWTKKKITMRHPMRLFKGLYFVQNGPFHSTTNVLDGRGHVTCVHLYDGFVSEAFVPPVDHAVGLSDLSEHPWRTVWKAIFAGDRLHGGVSNTAVVHERNWYAVEEASHRYKLDFEGDGLVGTGSFEKVMMSPHANDCRYHYLATRPLPLQIDGVSVPWTPRPRPFAIHSCACAINYVVFPIMATCFGRYGAWVLRKIPLPLQIYHSGWLVYDTSSGKVSEVRCQQATDVFHIAKVTYRDNHLAIFASHVHNFAEFVSAPTSVAPNITFEKHVVCLDTHVVRERVVYTDAAGDFPNPMSQDLVLMNTMKDTERGTSLVVFDTKAERKVRCVQLFHNTTDVLCLDDRRLIYATLDEVVIYDWKAKRIFKRFAIPRRARNFHASLLSTPIRDEK